MEASNLQLTLLALEARFAELSEISSNQLEKLTIERDTLKNEKIEAQLALANEKIEAQLALANEKVAAKRAFEQLEAKGLELQKQLQQTTLLLSEKQTEAKRAIEEAETNLLQLHCLQEELEHYFLLSQRQSEMLSSSENLLMKATTLLSRIIQ